MVLLSVSGLFKAYDGKPVLQEVSFDVAEGEIVCLLGPSGCGKTTLLRIVAGLEQADAGSVAFAGQDLSLIAVHRRGFGLMFQDYALFPHKNVGDNVAFGLRMAGQDRETVNRRVGEMLALVGLTGYQGRSVHELSGGEQQRVALARSLAPSPPLLMLDEPLGSLDRTLREELMTELRRILKQVEVTTLYVTHDQQEAFAIADRVIILNAGRIEQEGAPLRVYRHPASPFVARFLGMHNLLPGQMDGTAGNPRVVTPVGVLVCRRCRSEMATGDSVVVLLRPDGARVLSDREDDGTLENSIGGRLLSSSFRGSQVQVQVDHGFDPPLVFLLPGAAADDLPLPGRPIRLQLDPDAISLL